MTSDPITPRTPFARLRIQKASELLAQQIRAAVLLGELPEGSVLPSEKELTDQFGVSRATVREGLRLLEAEGLIVTRVGRGGGAAVRRPPSSGHTRSLALLLHFDGTTLQELLEARRAIEPLCSRLAAERITEAQLAELRAMIEQLATLIDDRLAYLALQVRFHLLIAHAAQNIVLRIYATSLAELTYEQIQRVPFTREDLKAGIEGCAAVLEALEYHDGAWSESRLAKHLAAVEESIARLGHSLDTLPTELAGFAGAPR
jgi:GntR family transcriptional regulator, transcriptional repressor for pyruvate dehydrogenase complex